MSVSNPKVNQGVSEGASVLKNSVPKHSMPKKSISENLAAVCPRALAERHHVIPLRQDGDTLVVGAAHPLSDHARQEIAFATGHSIKVEPVSETRIAACYTADGNPPPSSHAPHQDSAPHQDADVQDADTEHADEGQEAFPRKRDAQDEALEDEPSAGAVPEANSSHKAAAPRLWENLRVEGSAPQQVHQIIQGAIACGASDIHIEPYAETYRVRYRLDGVLHEVAQLALRRQPELTARIKIMAELDIAEKRRPQDGRITVRPDRSTVQGSTAQRSGAQQNEAQQNGAQQNGAQQNRSQRPSEIDLRVSTLPTAFGEKVVLRVLDRSDITLDLKALGFAAADRTAFEQAIHRPHGMVLVTGPTGSGKTTTLYAALQAVASERLNVQTIEDPIEYEIPGINQAQAHPDIGFAFADALRAFLRQDPDVIMVGEIRDQETAQIAIRAALTGHLVLSILHTNDAPSAPGRLIDMGVPPYLVASSVTLIMAQRLVRTICPECATPHPITEEQRDALGLSASVRTGQCGTGCPACHDTGYQGRTAVSEVMSMSKTLARRVSDGEDTSVIRDQAIQDGMRTLRASAAAKVAGGQTTPKEALRQGSLRLHPLRQVILNSHASKYTPGLPQRGGRIYAG